MRRIFSSFPAILALALALASCSSSDDDGSDKVSTIALCARSTYTSFGSTSTDEQPCLFYVFPQDNYISVKREGTITGIGAALIRVSAYAFRSANDSVAAIGVGLYTGDSTGQPIPVNGSNDTFWRGNYTVIAIPYDYIGIRMSLYSCCMMTNIHKPKNSSVVFLQPKFNKNELYDKYNEWPSSFTIIPWVQ